MKKIILLLLVVISLYSFAGTVDTVVIYSNAMHKGFKCVVVKPDSYQKMDRFPVVYLLHGYSGVFSDWVKHVPEIKDYADKYQLLIVCPDGGYSSWYYDSPVDSTMRYETYVGKEVVNYIDSAYHTIKDKSARAITGLSMGGHGAFYLALRHQDIFGAIGAMSGGLDINASRNKFEIIKRIGDTITYAQNWKDYSDIYIIDRYSNTKQRMIFDCGTGDFYYEANKAFHQKLLKLKIVHDYIERPGQHDWNYWSNSIEYHLLFFRKFFDGKN